MEQIYDLFDKTIVYYPACREAIRCRSLQGSCATGYKAEAASRSMPNPKKLLKSFRVPAYRLTWDLTNTLIMKARIEHINPDGLFRSPAFSQAVAVSGKGTTVYIGGQNAVNASGEVVGASDLAAQTRQVMENIRIILAECGATFADVVKMNIYIVQGQDATEGYAAAQPFFDAGAPPAITAAFVAGLARPEFLVEVDGIVFVAAKK